MRRKYVQLVLPILAITAGCTTTGRGFGSAACGANPTTFTWKSYDGHSGTISATLCDGTNYTGQYFQITRNTPIQSIAPLFDGWYSGWDETDWNVGASPDFITRYTGRVLANLASSSGSHMRCKFQLVYPDNGMYGGGKGECQLPDGKTIDARFPPA